MEASLLLGPLLRALAGAMHRGYAFFVDYGDERPRIHDEGRRDGTLRAFHRHAVASDVFLRIGEQDLTWSVDFTALAEAAEAAGFDVAGLVPQGEFLVNLGLVDYHARLAAQDPLAALRVKTLFLPGGMGESVKVLALAKGAPPRLPAVRRSYR